MIARLIIVIVMGLSGLLSGVLQTALAQTASDTPTLEAPAVETPAVETPAVGTAASDSASTSSPAQTMIEQQGAAALGRIAYDWQARLPGWTITFEQANGGPYGMTFTKEKRIEIYVRSDQPAAHLAHVIAHELGHAVDVTLNTGDERRAWQQARGISDEDWWPDSGARDFSTGAGDFAESFANWQLDDDIFRSTLADEPDDPELRLMATLANNN